MALQHGLLGNMQAILSQSHTKPCFCYCQKTWCNAASQAACFDTYINLYQSVLIYKKMRLRQIKELHDNKKHVVETGGNSCSRVSFTAPSTATSPAKRANSEHSTFNFSLVEAHENRPVGVYSLRVSGICDVYVFETILCTFHPSLSSYSKNVDLMAQTSYVRRSISLCPHLHSRLPFGEARSAAVLGPSEHTSYILLSFGYFLYKCRRSFTGPAMEGSPAVIRGTGLSPRAVPPKKYRHNSWYRQTITAPGPAKQSRPYGKTSNIAVYSLLFSCFVSCREWS